MNAHYQCSIQKLPSGKFWFVGSVPESLCELKANHIGQKYFGSMVFNTLEEAEKALNETV